MIGWIKLHRMIFKNKLYFKEPFTSLQAWVDLLLLASYEPTHFFIRGARIDLKRGQIGYSELSLAERWQWSRNRVRNFLDYLETEQQISYIKNNLTTIISIINYDLYQNNDEFDDTANNQSENANNPINEAGVTSNDTTEGTHLKNNKEYKEYNKGEQPSDAVDFTPFPQNPRPKKKAKRGTVHFNPEDVDKFIEDVRLRAKYRQWLEYRKQKGKPVSIMAAQGHFELLLVYPVDQAIEIINRSINSDWQGLFPIKGNTPPPTDNRPKAEKL